MPVFPPSSGAAANVDLEDIDLDVLPEETTPAAGDEVLLEKPDGEKRRLDITNFPAGAPPNKSVTLAKLADLPPSSLVGRPEATAGDPSAVNPGSLDNLVSPADDDIVIVRDTDASLLTRLSLLGLATYVKSKLTGVAYSALQAVNALEELVTPADADELVVADADVAGTRKRLSLTGLATFILAKLGATSAGDLLVATGANAFARLGIGGDGTFLQVSGSSIVWGAAPSGGGVPDDGSVTNQKLADDAVTWQKIANGTIRNENINGGTITGVKIAGGTIGNNKLATMAAGTVKGVPVGGGTTTPQNLSKAELRKIVLDGTAEVAIADDDLLLFRDTSDSNSGQGITAAQLAVYVGSKIGSGAGGNVELVDEDVDSSERTTTSTAYDVAHTWTPTVPADGNYFIEFFMASGSSSNSSTVRVDARLDPTSAGTGGTKLDDLGAGLAGQADIAYGANGGADRAKPLITSQIVALTAGTSHTLEAAIRKTGGGAVATLYQSRFRLWRVHS